MKYFNAIIRYIFWGIIIRLVVMVVLGINIRRRELLPKNGPAIIVANHNSHLDTMVLMSLYPLCKQKYVKPAAAADHFLRNKIIKWFALNIIGIAPLERKVTKSSNPLEACSKVLENNNILILYPEGSRGEPEHMANLKSGIAHLAKAYPNVPIIPVFMHGLGKALPKDDFILVPFFCDIFVGDAIYWQGDKQQFMDTLSAKFEELSHEKIFASWE